MAKMITIEGPLDYRTLWTALYNELNVMKRDIAARSATVTSATHDDFCIQVARHQGAYKFVDRLQAKMDEIVSEARSGSGNGRYAAEDDA